jgi:hypothetical protein
VVKNAKTRKITPKLNPRMRAQTENKKNPKRIIFFLLLLSTKRQSIDHITTIEKSNILKPIPRRVPFSGK